MTDKIFLIVGTVCAILHGSGFPIVMLIFGQLTDAFIDQAVTAGVADPDTAGGISACISDSYPNLDNMTAILEALAVNITTGDVNCDARFDLDNVSVTFDDLVPKCFRGREGVSWDWSFHSHH